MFLAELLEGLEFDVDGDGDVTVPSVAVSPISASSGCVYVKARYPREPPPLGAAEAVARGARVVVVLRSDGERAPLARQGVTVVAVDDVDRANAVICANYWGNPHRELTLIGVTGTKGKSTTCHLIQSILRAEGLSCGLMTSIERRSPRAAAKGSSTTPIPFELHVWLRRMLDEGATHAVIEVTSIGLAEQRVYGLRFDGAILTNIGNDHLTYHGGRAAYEAQKRRLFEDPSFRSQRFVSVLNADDELGRSLRETAGGRVLSYGFRDGDVRPTASTSSVDGVALSVDGLSLRSRLLGEHNAYNVLAAYTMSKGLSVDREAMIRGVAALSSVPGRMERVPSKGEVAVFVDYAHTPESVRAVLESFALLGGARRRVALLGCGGGTDRSKRPLMAAAAFELSDFCVLTNDNPRNEDPGRIFADLLEGVPEAEPRAGGRVRVVPDRRDAIELAIRLAMPDGLVLLLGRGDERVQVLGTGAVPFVDKDVARAVLDRLYT